MPFAATTCDRVIGCLELPMAVNYTQPDNDINALTNYVQAVNTALTTAQTLGGEAAVTRIEGYLTRYESQETALNADSAGAGLIKADVLEWLPGGKTHGFKQEMRRLQRLVARSLGLEHLMGGGRRVRLVR